MGDSDSVGGEPSERGLDPYDLYTDLNPSTEDYRLLAILADTGPSRLRQLLDDGINSVHKVAMLILAGDDLILERDSGDYPTEDYWQAAVRFAMEPSIQLELGCILLQRAQPPEMPLCEHMYLGRSYDWWEPHVPLHNLVDRSPPDPYPERAIEIALQAYSNAWAFYEMAEWVPITWSTKASTPERTAITTVRTYFALDGVRVCCERLSNLRALGKLNRYFKNWLEADKRRLDERQPAEWHREFGDVLAEVRERFARSTGRLEPLAEGQDRAERRLRDELSPDWEWIPLRVRSQLVTADWKAESLIDPGYDLWDVAHNYCLAVEGMLNIRLGRYLDSFIESNHEVAKPFQHEFLGDGKWKAAGLTIVQWERNLRQPLFKEMLSRIGLDSKRLHRIPDELKSVLPYRKQAHHLTEEGKGRHEALAKDDLRSLRRAIVGSDQAIIRVLSRIRPTLPDDNVA